MLDLILILSATTNRSFFLNTTLVLFNTFSSIYYGIVIPACYTMRLGLNGLETGDAGIRTRARFQPVYALVQARTR